MIGVWSNAAWTLFFMWHWLRSDDPFFFACAFLAAIAAGVAYAINDWPTRQST